MTGQSDRLFVSAIVLSFALPLGARGQEASAQFQGSGVLTINGVVVNDSGAPVPGAALRFVWYNNEAPSATTDADGRFVFNVPRNGSTSWYASIPIWVEADEGRLLGFARVNGEIGDPADLRIVVSAPHELKARVVDAKGNAVGGADVEVSEQETSIARGVTDDQGVCVLKIPKSSKVFWVIGLKDGAGFDYFENARTSPPITDASLALPTEVTLKLDGAQSAKATVLDADGNPLPDVELGPWTIQRPGKVRWLSATWSRAARRVSDAKGVVRFDYLPAVMGDDDRTVFFRISDPRFWARTRCIFDPKEPERELSTTAEARTMVTGRVTDSARRPLGGVRLLAEGHANGFASLRYFATTEADGTYVLEIPSNWHTILSIDEREWTAPSRIGLSPDEQNAEGNVDFMLVKGTVIHGVVTDKNGQKPIAGAVVRLWEHGATIPTYVDPDLGERSGEEEYLNRTAVTDGEGRYAFRVGSGRYQIAGPGQPIYSNAGEERILTVGGESEIERNLEVEPPARARTVTGRVVDASGKPVANATVVGVSSERFRHETRFDARTDADGRFGGSWAGDAATVAVTTADRALAGLVMLAPGNEEELLISLRATTTARGRLLAEDGKPATEVQCYCKWGPKPQSQIDASAAFFTFKPDAEGRFEINGLLPGTHAMIYALRPAGNDAYAGLVDFANGPAFEVGDAAIDLEDITVRFPQAPR